MKIFFIFSTKLFFQNRKRNFAVCFFLVLLDVFSHHSREFERGESVWVVVGTFVKPLDKNNNFRVIMNNENRDTSNKVLECTSKHAEVQNNGEKTQITNGKNSVVKREGYLSWDDYFMSVAFLSAQRSKDPSTQVGACIANEEKRIVGIGYNGMPCGCSDDVLPWARNATSKNGLDTKYMYVVHAEANAILNKNCESLKGCTIYVALFPCNECTKLIIQSGIKKVVYYSDKYKERNPFIASRRMLNLANVECVQYTPTKKCILIDFSCIDK